MESLLENYLYQELWPRDQWCTWRSIDDRKIPSAKVNDPMTFSSYEEVKDNPHKGFIITMDDPYVAIDLDDCVKRLPSGSYSFSKLASKVLFEMNSYAEFSPSGTGIHVWGKGVVSQAAKTPEVEVYGFDRYMTLTFSTVLNFPVADIQGPLDELVTRLNRPVDQLPGGHREYKAIPEKPSLKELRWLYTHSQDLKDLWALKRGYTKADGTPDYSMYDWDLCRILSLWERPGIAWAINFFRLRHGFPQKRPGAIAMTISKVKGAK